MVVVGVTEVAHAAVGPTKWTLIVPVPWARKRGALLCAWGPVWRCPIEHPSPDQPQAFWALASESRPLGSPGAPVSSWARSRTGRSSRARCLRCGPDRRWSRHVGLASFSSTPTTRHDAWGPSRCGRDPTHGSGAGLRLVSPVPPPPRAASFVRMQCRARAGPPRRPCCMLATSVNNKNVLL